MSNELINPKKEPRSVLIANLKRFFILITLIFIVSFFIHTFK